MSRIKFIQNKKVLSNVLVAMCLVFSGCVGFTEDWFRFGDACDEEPMSVVATLEPEFKAARFVQSGKIDVDSEHDSVTIILEIFGGCLKDNGGYAWDGDFYYVNERTYAYSFREDTLLLTYTRIPDRFEANQDTFDVSVILVGGTPGSLEGIWRLTQCQYAEGKMQCYDDGFDKYFKFYESSVEIRIDDRVNYDYITTYFVRELFDFLESPSASIDIGDVFYRYAWTNWLEESGVKVQEKTNRSVNFEFDGRAFELQVEFARYRDSVAVSLKSGNTNCVGTYFRNDDVSEEVCSVENADYLRKQDSGALEFVRQNSDEFEKCIDGILGREQND
ncbi:MAG: hypothetical protein IK012_04800 [Fibrobacter sp.]|uniref:hypothetical protein n=1 Tax=Fibrobacter sp. TaxID=35828 RepID=UPI0025B939F2|nr:hypothetical protein [Fibrobacter sp.]MBR4784557.1 hypothetical protein [Fibrobacter sp.]